VTALPWFSEEEADCLEDETSCQPAASSAEHKRQDSRRSLSFRIEFRDGSAIRHRRPTIRGTCPLNVAEPGIGDVIRSHQLPAAVRKLELLDARLCGLHRIYIVGNGDFRMTSEH